MSRPIREPSDPSRITGLGYDTRQLQRRPSPIEAAASGLTRQAPIFAELVTVNNALPQSAAVWTKYPFDLTYGGTNPVGTAIGNGTALPATQYFVFDVDNCCIGVPYGGIVAFEALFQAANYPDIGTTWDMAIKASPGDCDVYDPDDPPTVAAFFGLHPDNVSIYDAAAMVVTNAAFDSGLYSTTDAEARQWLQFYYMHNGPTVEDTNFSRILLRIGFWPAGYDWNNGFFFGTQGKGVLVVSPAVPETITAGDPVTVTFAGEENPTTTDWIGCFPLGSDTGETNWVYTNSGTQVAGGTPVSSGSWTIDTSGLSAGDYQFRWMYNDGAAVLADGDSFIRVV